MSDMLSISKNWKSRLKDPNGVITASGILTIRRMWALGQPKKTIAKILGISYPTVSKYTPLDPDEQLRKQVAGSIRRSSRAWNNIFDSPPDWMLIYSVQMEYIRDRQIGHLIEYLDAAE